ncbi:hypothetical protein FRC00_010432 [Tulasnella sp. 408]|nr:hypothetical protein FRC00_010432 [Tulasnella sp. 408]
MLLDSIEAPSLSSFHVEERYKWNPEDCTALCESAGRYIGAFPLPKPRDEEQGGISIGFREWEINLSIAGRSLTVWNSTWTSENGPEERIAYLASFTKHLDERVCEEVKVLTLWSDVEIDGYLGIIHARFPFIDEVVLKGAEHFEVDVAAVCGRLRSPSQLGSAIVWLLPKLTKLTLEQNVKSGELDHILKLVESRKSAGETEIIKEITIARLSGSVRSSVLEKLRQSVEVFKVCHPMLCLNVKRNGLDLSVVLSEF